MKNFLLNTESKASYNFDRYKDLKFIPVRQVVFDFAKEEPVPLALAFDKWAKEQGYRSCFKIVYNDGSWSLNSYKTTDPIPLSDVRDIVLGSVR